MNESGKIDVDDLPWHAWQRLAPHVKTDLLSVLEPIAGTPPEKWPPRIRPWRPEANLYVIPAWVGPEELYVFFSPQGERIRIEAMYPREFAERMRTRPVAEASAS